MLTVLNSPDLAGKFRQNGPITADGYTWEKATDRFEKALLKLIDNKAYHRDKGKVV